MGDTVGFLDTNILVRHLTGDPEDAARRAGRLLAEARALFVPDLVMAELAYVLERRYRASRQQVAEALQAILAFRSIHTAEPDVLHRAIEV